MSHTQNDQKSTPIDIWVVALDETKYWLFQDQPWAGLVERIEGVYFFDRNRITHLCSFSGSYWLEHVESRIIWKNDWTPDSYVNPVSDETRERAQEWINSGLIDDQSKYADEHGIDQFIERVQSDDSRVVHRGDPGFDPEQAEGEDAEQKYQTVMDAVLESLRANSVI